MVVPQSPLDGSPALLGINVTNWPRYWFGRCPSQNEANRRLRRGIAWVDGGGGRYGRQEVELDLCVVVRRVFRANIILLALHRSRIIN